MKKRNLLASGIAVLLAATMVLGGGTFAYLSGTTGEVENTFTQNNNGVELTETTGGTYDIVPGTSQDKDPIVTATYTLDSYVFVEVTDATDDLVTWYIANGWTQLSTTDNADGSTTYVYYQLLAYDDTAAVNGLCKSVLPVLADNKVYYSATLTNADLDYTDTVSLTFQAHIMQAEPFADAENAWLVLNGKGVAINDNTGIVYTNETTGVLEAINEASDGDTIRLLKDNLSISCDTTIRTSMTLELDGYTLSMYGTNISNGADLTIQNGTINSKYGFAQSNTTDSDLIFHNVKLTVTDGHAIQAFSGTIVVDSESSVKTTALGAYCAIFIGSNLSVNNGKKVTLDIYGTVETVNSSYAISGNGSYDATSTEINIYEGATVSGPEMAIYHPQDYGVINIYGGTVTGYNGILIAGGTLNIYGGNVIGLANDPDYRSSGAGTYYNGSAICVYAASTFYSDVTVNISGGTISSTYCYAIWADALSGVAHTATINITGGTFNGVTSSDTDVNQANSSATGEYAVSNAGISTGKVIIIDNR